MYPGDREDRLSGLPRNVIDCILELLPSKDAARTSVLSKNWRYSWAMLPTVILDLKFWYLLTQKFQHNFNEVVDMILLRHLGDILKFVLNIPETNSCSDTDIDRYMLYVTRNGIKDLSLRIPAIYNTPATYKLPLYVINCPTLTHLKLSNCVFELPNPFLGFHSLRTFHLYKVTFVPTTELCVIKAPLLVELVLVQCRDTQYLNIVSPRLEDLFAFGNQGLMLKCFVSCKNLRFLQLHFNKVDDNLIHDARSILKKLLVSTSLEKLNLGSFELELLSADIDSKGQAFTLNYMRHLSLTVDFGKLSQISYTLHLLKSLPNLSELCIWVERVSGGAEAVSKHLDTPACLDRSLDKLEYVSMPWFNGSKAEVLFIKLLLLRSPSLVNMCIQLSDKDSTELRNISVDLSRFCKASPVAEVFIF